MMTAKTLEKLAALKKAIPTDGILYNDLVKLTCNNAYPSISTLEKNHVLRVIRTNEYDLYADADDDITGYDEYMGWTFNRKLNKWVLHCVDRYYGID